MRYLGRLILITAAVCGCSRQANMDAPIEPAPRPVSVFTLVESAPARSMMLTGVVGSWKTEDLGFEVSGRVNYVIGTETNVDGPLKGRSGQPIASIDPEKYDTAVESAKAQIEMLQRKREAAEIQWKNVLPFQRDAEMAAKKLADADLERGETLIKRNALSQAELDQFIANRTSAVARVAQTNAEIEAKAAEVTSLDAQIREAAAALKDAERDQADCEIKAPFRGQIAQVHVIPGGTVQRGEPVVTLQMMDPVKVEFEVSAEQVREMKYKDSLSIILTRPDGTDVRAEGAIWNTDSTADPNTRTFTITVLTRNQLEKTEIPGGQDVPSLVKTRDIWKFARGVIGDLDRYYLETNSIHADDNGEYIWRITDAGDVTEGTLGPLLKVEKVYVKADPEEDVVDFLGLWKFRAASAVDESAFDYEEDRVLGELVLPDGVDEFTGGVALFEREQWMLRPGDLVGVDLSRGSLDTGFYVPIDAINEKSGRRFIYAVEEVGENSKVRQIEVTVFDGPNTRKRIEAVSEPLAAGMRIVLGGVHYLTDGETVNVAATVETNE